MLLFRQACAKRWLSIYLNTIRLDLYQYCVRQFFCFYWQFIFASVFLYSKKFWPFTVAYKHFKSQLTADTEYEGEIWLSAAICTTNRNQLRHYYITSTCTDPQNTNNWLTSLHIADTLMCRYKYWANSISSTRSPAQTRCRRLPSGGSTNTLCDGSALHSSENTASAAFVLPITARMTLGSPARSSSCKTVCYKIHSNARYMKVMSELHQ